MEYPVKSRLIHDGKSHPPGDLVALTEEQAEGLIALGVLGPAQKPPDPPKPAARSRKAAEPAEADK
ncbi:hypothetical protein GS597_09205 [Synechococcales cyanobacterium C]|uniref:DUF7210 domain-containing protein n=1 Tax=Petrachloros mirabilis ULC683 TaxID=2781853 RepID=A0A8K2A870_9CYAN|nr:hypothetical protein [Petrachloros mirabilis]NCJ06680.1 hypothetical protein [Petrachloros mirabilis ULC683]